MKLSDRVRPDVEAAPWVIEEIKKLEAERDALVALRKVRYETAKGETRGEMAAHCREGDLYRIGDAILVWVNEGDIIAFGQRIDAARGEK